MLAGQIDQYSLEKRYIRKDGETMCASLDVGCVRALDGGVDYVVALIEDITDRKQAEEEKSRLEAQLRQAQKMESVGRLAGGVAHDFNNMLGVIIGHVDLAREQVDPAQPLYADLIEIRRAAERSADLTRQLLAFARKQTVSPRVLDLSETLSGMLKMLGRLIGEDVDLIRQPEADLWAVKVDPSQIDQIVANLCVNARDAIGGVGHITIETKNSALSEDYCAHHLGCVPGDYVRLTVADDGCGMDEETLTHLFEPFFTTKEVGRGTGLGLATVYGIVKQNDGFITVESEPGRGTTFTIYLPRYVGKTGGMRTETPTLPPARGQETVLVVEDEPTILKDDPEDARPPGLHRAYCGQSRGSHAHSRGARGGDPPAHDRRGHARDERPRPGEESPLPLSAAPASLHVRLHGRHHRPQRCARRRGVFPAEALLYARPGDQGAGGA